MKRKVWSSRRGPAGESFELESEVGGVHRLTVCELRLCFRSDEPLQRSSGKGLSSLPVQLELIGVRGEVSGQCRRVFTAVVAVRPHHQTNHAVAHGHGDSVDLTPWNLFWAGLILWGVWMFIVILLFALRHESTTWQEH